MIISDERRAQRKRVGGDHGVEVSYRLALAFQRGTKLTVLLGCVGIPRQDRHAQEEVLDHFVQSLRMGKARGSEAQLAFGNRGYGELRHRNIDQVAIYGRAVPLDNAARDIGVDQITGHYLADHIQHTIKTTRVSAEIHPDGRP